MKPGARNRPREPVAGGNRRAVNSAVRIGSGAIVTAMITNSSVAELGVASGKTACAVIKAPNVMVLTDQPRRPNDGRQTSRPVSLAPSA
ncbi:TOBE domain-containing protein [Marimonas lutisalis]|uniref:TOBE domain-containing protein n=1 Tax=Marimonas lutisalis TaxID=2545756 RepID=UPI0010F4571B|nr:TOBE domain-containing protein [Marimonas lutisalis]